MEQIIKRRGIKIPVNGPCGQRLMNLQNTFLMKNIAMNGDALVAQALQTTSNDRNHEISNFASSSAESLSTKHGKISNTATA